MTNYKTIQALSKDTLRAAEGTLAYVSEKGGQLYVKAQNGWRKVQVGQLLHPYVKMDSVKGKRSKSAVVALTQTLFFQLGGLINNGASTSAASQSLSRSGGWSKPQRVHSQVQTTADHPLLSSCEMFVAKP